MAVPITTRATKGAALTFAELDGNFTSLNSGKSDTGHQHGVADLTATGTRDATTFLRGDNTWAVVAGGGGTYTLPVATTTVLGGVKDGTGLTIAGDGTASVDYGTTAGTAAQGNDARITGALSTSVAATTYAPIASPTFTGTPNAPTAAAATNTTQVATTAFVQTAVGTAQVAAVPQFEVAAGQTLAVTRGTHQGGEITLAGAGATLSFDAQTQGNGFTILVRNRTGAAWTVPSFTTGLREYRLGAAHTQVSNNGDATLTVYTRTVSGTPTRFVAISGDTQ